MTFEGAPYENPLKSDRAGNCGPYNLEERSQKTVRKLYTEVILQKIGMEE